MNNNKINIGSFIDLLFILLIFFIIHILNMQEVHSIQINTPSSQTATMDKNENIIISITENGEFYLDDIPYEIQNLAANIPKDKLILIKADKNADYKYLIQVIDILRTNKIHNFGLLTDKE